MTNIIKNLFIKITEIIQQLNQIFTKDCPIYSNVYIVEQIIKKSVHYLMRFFFGNQIAYRIQNMKNSHNQLVYIITIYSHQFLGHNS